MCSDYILDELKVNKSDINEALKDDCLMKMVKLLFLDFEPRANEDYCIFFRIHIYS